jgi:hypothetical protein
VKASRVPEAAYLLVTPGDAGTPARDGGVFHVKLRRAGQPGTGAEDIASRGIAGSCLIT